LSRRGFAVAANSGKPNAIEIVACGQPVPGHEAVRARCGEPDLRELVTPDRTD